VQLFVNTTDHEHSRELLGSPAHLSRGLRRPRLVAMGALLTD
jgi:hypothetical protein